MENALLVDWYEEDGWEVEDSGGGCSALFKRTGSTILRITKADDPSAPQTMAEPITVGAYSADDDSPLQQECRIYQGGIQEMLGTPD